jgi:LacI family transcriptional regulator
MADVAREAGVSLMTVSRVVNSKGEISEETRRRVQAVIEKTGYRPSGIARSLAGGQTYTMGLIVPDIANPYFSGIAQGVASVTNAENFSVLLCNCEEDPELEIKMLDVLDEKRVDGVIVAAPRTATEKLIPAIKQHANVVIINRLFDEIAPSLQKSSVLNDDKASGYMITQHFLQGGHTKIGVLAGPKTSYGSIRRLDGYAQALAENDLDLEPDLIRYCIPTVEGGQIAFAKFISEHPEITALFCFNDLVAIGVIQQCQQLGIRIPDELAVFGCDDIPMASWVTPTLSTSQANFEQMGREATKLLLNHISGCADQCENLVIQPKLIFRDSAPFGQRR